MTECVCIASGPSLTSQDVELVRQWRNAGEGRRVIVVNTTYQAAPWADELYAMDRAWWNMYGKDAVESFKGERTAPLRGIPTAKFRQFDHGKNSGLGAIALAVSRGAKRVILIGYDGQYAQDGRRHHHGDHPKGLGNAGSVARWPREFDRAARRFAGIEIINCSRETALTCWPRMSLEQALEMECCPL